MRNGGVWLGVVVMAGILGWGARVDGAQQIPSQSPFGTPDASGRGGRNGERDTALEHMQEKAAETRNAERQKRLVTDTEKLLSLATELKQDVDKTDKNTLSVDVVRKADEIEKLAHNVKERMKG